MPNKPINLEDSARDRLRVAIEDLMRTNPEDWTKLVASQAAAACIMNPEQLDDLVRSAMQLATMAHKMRQELEDEDGESGEQ